MASKMKNLDFKTAGFWPTSMKVASYFTVFAAVLVLGWLFVLSPANSKLDGLKLKEVKLREDFDKVQSKANNLDNLKNHLAELNVALKSLVLRLPSKNEIPELVVNVSQEATGQGLQVDLFEPKEESNKEFYAEKRIDVALRGSYHQLGAFFNDVASQPRLVAVVPDQMQVQIAKEEKADKTKAKNGDANDAINVGESLEKSDLIFTGSVITYRYMSEDEIMANAEEAESKDKNGKRVRKKEPDDKK